MPPPCGSDPPTLEERDHPSRCREPALALPADNEGLDVVPAVAIRGQRYALLELGHELGEKAASPAPALEGECAEEERPALGGDAPDVAPREHRGVVIPVGVVETEELGALEL